MQCSTARTTEIGTSVTEMLILYLLKRNSIKFMSIQVHWDWTLKLPRCIFYNGLSCDGHIIHKDLSLKTNFPTAQQKFGFEYIPFLFLTMP